MSEQRQGRRRAFRGGRVRGARRGPVSVYPLFLRAAVRLLPAWMVPTVGAELVELAELLRVGAQYAAQGARVDHLDVLTEPEVQIQEAP